MPSQATDAGGKRRISMMTAYPAARRAVTNILLLGLGAFALSTMTTLSFTRPADAHEIKIGNLEIIHPWSREAPEGAQAASGYLEIHNKGALADRLLSVTAEIAGKAEIHTMSVDANGIMKMRMLADGVEIPAGGMIRLKPGADHIMFLQLTSRPMADTYFKGDLVFEKAGKIAVEFAVEKAGGHDHGDMHDQ